MHYTILHLPSGTEVYNQKTVFDSQRDQYGVMRHTNRREVYTLLVFSNIRQVRNHINNHRFYEDITGVVIDGGFHHRDCKISKHTLEPKRHEDV
jgi:hypothetical protein